MSGSVTGWGASVTGPWCLMAAQVAGVHCSPRSTRGFPRRRDEESSESLGVVRRTRGSGRRFGTPRGVRRGVRQATTRHRPAPAGAAGHDAARHARRRRRRRDRRRPAHRRVVVRLGRLPRGVRQGADDQARTLRRGGPRHRRRGGLQPGHRLPHPPAVHPGHPRAAGARAVPPGHRAAAADRRVGGPDRPRHPRRVRLDGRLAHLPAVGQPAAVRRQGPPVRPRRRVLRLQPAVAALHRQLRDGRARPGASSPRRSPTTSTAASSSPAAGRPPAPPTRTSASSVRSSR